MQTPSHFLMTAALRKAIPGVPMPRGAVLIGSIAPDLPLYLLTFGGIFYYEHVLDWPRGRAFHHMFDTQFYHDTFWIVSHNALHAPLVLLMAMVVLAAARALTASPLRAARLGWCLWFFAAAALHSYVDIFTHHDDGPLLLFPFEWTYRYPSPLSYWDSRHYGAEFARLEIAFDLLMAAYLFVPPLWRRLAGRRASGWESA